LFIPQPKENEEYEAVGGGAPELYREAKVANGIGLYHGR
jgi:hypothetical protein